MKNRHRRTDELDDYGEHRQMFLPYSNLRQKDCYICGNCRIRTHEKCERCGNPSEYRYSIYISMPRINASKRKWNTYLKKLIKVK